jgi:large subunit ribosomal protein L19e
MAASILGVGGNRVWFDPENLEAIASAVTKDDVRRLIFEGIIRTKKIEGTGRYRAKFRQAQRSKGRRRGHGKRKGTKEARFPKKRRWISTIRPIRSTLSELRDSEKIDSATYRKLYLMAKGGMFKSKAHLNMYLKERGIIKG